MEKDSLQIMNVPRPVLDELVRQVLALAKPLRIFLFGSAARDAWREGSDIDLLIVVPDSVNCHQLARNLYLNIHGIPIPYDLVVVNASLLEKHATTPGLIYRHALQEGEQLYAA